MRAALLILLVTLGVARAGVIREVVLELGEERQVEPTNCLIQSAYSSSDTVLSLGWNPTSLTLKAMEFGSSTVTVFCASGLSIIRVVVPTRSVLFPLPRSESIVEGSQGVLGTRVAFRSTRGLFDSRADQQEFFKYAEKGVGFSQSGALTLTDPIFFTDPKPYRTVDQVYWEYKRHGGGLAVRVGDFDPLQKGVTGSVRGARVDFLLGGQAPFVWAGIAHSGVGNPLGGAEASPIGGVGSAWTQAGIRLTTHVLGFGLNNGLALPEAGVEYGVRPSVQFGDVALLEAGVVGDRLGHLAYDGSLNLDWSSLSLNLNAAHVPDQLAVFTFPSRFSNASDLYGLSAHYNLGERAQLGASFGRYSTFSQMVGFLGTSLVDNGTVEVRANLAPLTAELTGNFYQSQFSPFSQGPAEREEGRRVEAELDWEVGESRFATLNGNAQAIQNTIDSVNYENQQLTLGWKRVFYSQRKDFIHFELGGTHLYYPSSNDTSGTFVLSRLSALWDAGFVKIDGLVQGETRFDAGLSHTLRLQAGVQYLPTTAHEIRVAVTNNMEWLRQVYSDTRGFFIYYAYKFGDSNRGEPVAANWEGASVVGRVYNDRDGSGDFGQEDEPLRGAPVSLVSERGEEKAVTDAEGLYHFLGVRAGGYSVRFDRSQIVNKARLITDSERSVQVRQGERSVHDFVLSDRAEIRGVVFDDIHRDGKLVGDSPRVPMAAVLWRDGSGREGRAETEGGRFRVTGLSEGQVELRVDPASLPSGFTVRESVKVMAGASRIENITIAVLAERSVSGRLFLDPKGTHTWDPSKIGIDGVKLKLGPFRAVTGEGGQFIFRHLPPVEGVVSFGDCKSSSVRLGVEPKTIQDVWVPCMK